jgi:predicted enzyme involved in methoxymalonyl-ACP biosynthesis
MEFAMMDELAARATAGGLKTVRGHYYPTAKNGMVRDFYSTQGFEKVSEDVEGNSEWLMPLDNYEKKNHVINVKEN